VTAANRKDTTPEPTGLTPRFGRHAPDGDDRRTGCGRLGAGGAKREEHEGEREVGNPEPWPAPVAHLFLTTAREPSEFTRRHSRAKTRAASRRAADLRLSAGGIMGDEIGRSTATKTSLDAGVDAAHAHPVVRPTRRERSRIVMFAQSHAYEPFMGRWSRRLAPLFVEFAGVQDGESVLEVGSGTGALASAIVEARPKAHVTAVEPAQDYVSAARQQAPRRGVRYVVGDAQTLDFSDGTFDRAVSLLALNFVPDPAQALAEQIRVTRPGGLIAAAVWDYGDGMQMLRVFWEEAAANDPAADARDERHMPLCRHSQLSALWLSHGMLAVGERPLTIEQPFASFEDYWTPFLGGQGPAGAYVASLSPAARTHLSDRLRRRLTGDHGNDGGPFVLTARAWAVKGYAPARG